MNAADRYPIETGMWIRNEECGPVCKRDPVSGVIGV